MKHRNLLRSVSLLTVLALLCLALAGCGSSGTTSEPAAEAAEPEAEAVTEAEPEEETEPADTAEEPAEPEPEEEEEEVPAGDPTCEALMDAVLALEPEGLSEATLRTSCTFLIPEYWDLLEDFCYYTDDDQLYCACIVKADSEADAQTISELFEETLMGQTYNDYLTTDEQLVVQAARTGISGTYVWYLSLSSSSDLMKSGENAIKDLL